MDADLQRDFGLHHTLSLYLVDAVAALDPASPDYAVDVISIAEAILEDPRALLVAQVRVRKDELIAAWKAEGVPFEERIARLEEVTWDAERVTSVDWRTYAPLYLGADVPQMVTILINQPDADAAGAGETSVTVTVAAIANAIFDATGARVRQVPMTPERVKRALEGRG